MTTTLCRQAHELLLARQERYGHLTGSWRRIAAAVRARTGVPVSPELALWVLVEMKLERHRHSPDDPDHLRDAIGYLGILGALQAEDLAAGGTGRAP